MYRGISHGFWKIWMYVNDNILCKFFGPNYSFKSCDCTQIPDSAVRWASESSAQRFLWDCPFLNKKCPCPACRVHITYNANRDLLLPLQENGRECYEVTFKTWLPFRQRHSGRFVRVICLLWEEVTVPMFKVVKVIHKALTFMDQNRMKRTGFEHWFLLI